MSVKILEGTLLITSVNMKSFVCEAQFTQVLQDTWTTPSNKNNDKDEAVAHLYVHKYCPMSKALFNAI